MSTVETFEEHIMSTTKLDSIKPGVDSDVLGNDKKQILCVENKTTPVQDGDLITNRKIADNDKGTWVATFHSICTSERFDLIPEALYSRRLPVQSPSRTPDIK
jgi:hypothetical protein